MHIQYNFKVMVFEYLVEFLVTEIELLADLEQEKVINSLIPTQLSTK